MTLSIAELRASYPPLPIARATRHISRDEMNLAEFPLTVLSTRSNSKLKTLEFSDSVRSKNGDLVERKWIITGADKFGLPTSSDDEVLLGLLKLTVDNGFIDRRVYFTRYELLKILHWTTEGRSYARLQKALDRLSGVRIKASNAFYDNEAKSHSTRNFGLIDAYEINDGRNTAPKPSFFIWSEVLFKSFQVGFIKKLDLDFYLGLKSAISKRLYRYLDKHFWYKSKVQLNLFTLAHEKIGISRNYVYASSIRQLLDPAVEELIEKGFVTGCEYIGKGKQSEMVIYASAAKPRYKLPDERVSVLTAQIEDPPSAKYSQVKERLIERGLKEDPAERLLVRKSDEALRKISGIIEYYDHLVSTKSHLVSRSPVGFLYRAVENYDTFVLPNERTPKNGMAHVRRSFEVSRTAVPKEKIQNEKTLEPSEAEYLVARKREVQKLRDTVEPGLLSKITCEVQEGLSKVKELISLSRFNEAVAHGVDERLLKLFAFPEFEGWRRRETSRK